MNIREKLIQLSDNEYKEFNQKLCPDTNRKMLGIKVPVIRKLAKEISKEYTLDEFEKEIKDEYFEEVLLEGIVIASSKIDFKDKISYIKNFVPKIDSWAISDTFVPTLKIKTKELETAWNFIMPYTKSKEQFDVRFAVIMMLDYFITEEYVDKVLEVLDSINHDGYYVKMAVAWTIAEIGIKFNDKAMQYLNNNNLDKFTYNKSLQKMIESFRISDEQKKILREMKIK